MAKENPDIPGAKRYAMVKAGFILQGTTFTAWCREHGIGHANAWAAILGVWNGPKAKGLVARIVAESGVTGA